MRRKIKPGNFPRHEDMHGVLPPHCWTNYPGELFNVRAGPNYAKTGNKQPSVESLYEVFAVDAYNTQGKMPHIGKDVELPPYNGTKLSLPEFIIINLMVPGYAPSLMWAAAGDGVGWSLIIYGRLKPSVREQLAAGRTTNAMNLVSNLVSAKEDSPLRKRFKIIAQVLNPDECGFGSSTASMVKKYNGKPFLVRTTSSFYSGENYFEICVDAHNFGKPARLGLWGFREVFQSVIFTGGFVVEGVDDKELPEQMLMACKYSKPDIESLPWFPDLTKEPAPDMSDLKTYLPSRCAGGEPEPGPADLLSKRDGEEGRGARRGSTRAEHNDTPSPT
jgi:hypothetical protein